MNQVIYKYYMLLRTAKQNGDYDSKQFYQKALNQLKRYFTESHRQVKKQIFGV